MKKKASRPMSARPRRGPTTAPAIQALLLLFCWIGPISPPPGIAEADGELTAAVEVVTVDVKVADGAAEAGVVTPGDLGQYEHFFRDGKNVLNEDPGVALAGGAR
jgi:hypothetical protein